MSISATIAPHLPFLRRFARALTGSQESGDAYAVATLEAILARQSIMPDEADPRAALYRIFLKIWVSLPINHGNHELAAADRPDAADRNLDAMTPLPRVAFLLQSMEEFSVERIAATLDRPVADVRALLEQAGEEISAQIRCDVLIIEDEPIIAMDLESLIQDLGHRVIQIARTRTEAIAAVADHRPGLVLADIQLADGSSGLDAVNDILASFQVPVIFVTAYPERLLTGVRPEPTFLIAKPFRAQSVKAIVSQALFFDRKAHPRHPEAASL